MSQPVIWPEAVSFPRPFAVFVQRFAKLARTNAPNIKWITASVVPRRVVSVPRNANAWHRRLDATVETLTPE